MKSSVWIMEIWVVYSLELLCLKLFWIFSRGYGVDMCFHFFWVNILGHRVSAYITLQKIAELFLKWWYHFILLPIMCESSVALRSCQYLVLLGFLIMDILMSMSWFLRHILRHISWLTNDDKHLSWVVIHLHTFFCAMSVLIFYPFIRLSSSVCVRLILLFS